MAYSHADDIAWNVYKGVISEEIILHHSNTTVSEYITDRSADWRCGRALTNASWTLVAFRWSQLPTQHKDFRFGTFFTSAKWRQETKTGGYDGCLLEEAAPGHGLWTSTAGWIIFHNEELDWKWTTSALGRWFSSESGRQKTLPTACSMRRCRGIDRTFLLQVELYHTA